MKYTLTIGYKHLILNAPMTTSTDPDWPFIEPRDTPVFTLHSILDGWEPIIRVTHDIEDSAWQFLSAIAQFDTQDVRVVRFEQIVLLDQSLVLLADLPSGWRAWRAAAHLPWQRAPEIERP